MIRKAAISGVIQFHLRLLFIYFLQAPKGDPGPLFLLLHLLLWPRGILPESEFHLCPLRPPPLHPLPSRHPHHHLLLQVNPVVFFHPNGGSFLTGRFSGIVLSNFLSPTTIILCSQVLLHLICTMTDLPDGLCVELSLLGVLRGLAQRGLVPWHRCHGFLGFHHVCLRFCKNKQTQVIKFCSGYSWLAEQVDLTGSRGGVVFLGANFGWLIFPPIGLHSATRDKIRYDKIR